MNARRERAAGFTLLEMTVVLTLVALMSIAIVESLRFGGRAYTQVVRASEASWDVFVAQRFLRRAIESAYPFEPDRAGGRAFGLEGSDAQLSVSAPAARSGAGGFNRYEVLASPDNNEARRLNLLVKWRVDRHGQSGDGKRRHSEEVLLRNISRLQWSYLGASCGAPATWQDTWQGHREPPALVRVRVEFPEGDARHWPELIVAPRITDDVMSWFYRPLDAASGCTGSP